MFDLGQYEIAINLMGLSMCLFMALFFFMDSQDKSTTTKSPRRFLSGFLLIYSVTFLDGFLMSSNINYNYPNMHGIFIPTYFLLGPFLYFYVRDTCSVDSYILIRPRLKHFIAFFLSILLLIPFFMLPQTEKQLIFSKNVISATEAILPWIAIFGILLVHVILLFQVLFYLIQSFRVLMRYFENLKDFFSNIEDNRLGWLRLLMLMLSISWAVYTYEAIIAWPETISDPIRTVISMIDVGIIYFISFKGLRQNAVFRDQINVTDNESEISANKIDDNTDKKQKYAKSALNDADAERIFEKLHCALSDQGIYSDSMLSLRGLSDHTKISSNYISQVINQKTKSHFFDFVNKYRIEAAMSRLADKEEKNSILDIAYSVGFNSKSTFNSAFKRQTGQTPSEYRKNYSPADE